MSTGPGRAIVVFLLSTFLVPGLSSSATEAYERGVRVRKSIGDEAGPYREDPSLLDRTPVLPPAESLGGQGLADTGRLYEQDIRLDGYDESTAQLISEFYEQPKNPEQSRADALRQAQLALQQSDDFRHPFYWAPLLPVGTRLSGDPS